MFLNPAQFNHFSTATPNVEFPPIVTRLRKQGNPARLLGSAGERGLRK
jgi:hypothetical protein